MVFKDYFLLNLYLLVHFCGADEVTEETQREDAVLQSINEMYEAYLEADKTGKETLTRRFYKDRKGFLVHVRKLGEVNGLKAHNLMLIQDEFLKDPVIYINNPVESEFPFAVLSLDEFKNAMLKRSMKQQAEFEYQKLAAQMSQVKKTEKPKTQEITVLRSGSKRKDKKKIIYQIKQSTTCRKKKAKQNKKSDHRAEKSSKKYISPTNKQTKAMTVKLSKVTENELIEADSDTTISNDFTTADSNTISEITSKLPDASSTVSETLKDTSIVSSITEITSTNTEIPYTSPTLLVPFETSSVIPETTQGKVPVLETAVLTTEAPTSTTVISTTQSTIVTTMSTTTVSTPWTRGRPFVFIGGALNS